MTEYQPLLDVTNPWQAMVAVALVFALLIWPQMSARQTMRKVEKTLTQNNGGASVVDRFDRIDKKLDEHMAWSDAYVREQNERITALEARAQPRGLFGRRQASGT